MPQKTINRKKKKKKKKRKKKKVDNPDFITFVVDFIKACLDSIPPQHLLADCLLLAGMLIGLSVDRRHLARLDKR